MALRKKPSGNSTLTETEIFEEKELRSRLKGNTKRPMDPTARWRTVNFCFCVVFVKEGEHEVFGVRLFTERVISAGSVVRSGQASKMQPVSGDEEDREAFGMSRATEVISF